jgi:hypothetical protein
MVLAILDVGTQLRPGETSIGTTISESHDYSRGGGVNMADPTRGPALNPEVNGDRLVSHLRALLGRRCWYRGKPWRLLDLLPSEGILVLESLETTPPILTDQYGRASHRASRVLQVPIFGAARDLPSAQLHELLSDLDSRPEG